MSRVFFFGACMILGVGMHFYGDHVSGNVFLAAAAVIGAMK